MVSHTRRWPSNIRQCVDVALNRFAIHIEGMMRWHWEQVRHEYFLDRNGLECSEDVTYHDPDLEKRFRDVVAHAGIDVIR